MTGRLRREPGASGPFVPKPSCGAACQPGGCLRWEAPSTGVCWRPWLLVAIVTQLVTRPSPMKMGIMGTGHGTKVATDRRGRISLAGVVADDHRNLPTFDH
jgi:hypothetical protein